MTPSCHYILIKGPDFHQIKGAKDKVFVAMAILNGRGSISAYNIIMASKEELQHMNLG